jgi:hypothetical protein
MNINMENNNTKTILNEGVIQNLAKRLFGKSFKSTVAAASEGLLNSALTKVVSGGKKFSISALRKTPEYQKALIDLVNEASVVRHKMSFDDLAKSKNKDLAKKLVDDVQGSIEKEIADKAATGKNLIDADVKVSQNNIKTVANQGGDVAVASRQFKNDVKLQRNWADAQKKIAGMTPQSVAQIQKIMKAEAKVTTGTGPTIAGTVGQNAVVQTKTGIFTMTKDQLKKFPGAIKKVVVNNKMLSTLAVAGLSAYALYQFFGATDDSSTILVDENGNPIKDTPPVSGQWLPCIKQMIDSKEGTMITRASGEISVLVKNSEFPGGLQYYPNGRVMNTATKEMGTYVCKDGAVVKENKPTINEVVGRILRERLLKEQSDTEIDNDAEEMVDLLDFPVSGNDMQSALNKLKKYSTSPKGKDFLQAYKDTGLGSGDLKKTLSYITTTQASSARAKRTMLSLISQIESGTAVVNPPAPAPTPGGGNSGTVITWDKDKKKDGGDKVDGGDSSNKPKKNKSSFKDCEGQDFPLAYGCKSSKIAEVQKCLGVADDGKFGKDTMKALVDNKYDTSRGLSKDVYDAVKGNCNPTTQRRKLDTTPIELAKSKGLKMSSLAPGSIKLPDLSKMIQMNQPPIDFYNVLKDAGYMRGDANETTLEDGTVLPATNRVKYKGPDLDDEILGKLDGILKGKGYERIKQKVDKSYGDKYVWLQQ